MAAVESPYLTVEGACAYLGRSRGWLRRHRDRIGWYAEGGRVYFKRADLDAFRSTSYMRPSALTPTAAPKPKPLAVLSGEINGFTGVPIGAYTGDPA